MDPVENAAVNVAEMSIGSPIEISHSSLELQRLETTESGTAPLLPIYWLYYFDFNNYYFKNYLQAEKANSAGINEANNKILNILGLVI